MFYMMQTPLFDNVFQSWMAAARDQATAQLIASLSIQKALQSRASSDMEACALALEDQMTSAYTSQVHTERRGTPRKTKKQLI